MIPAGVTRIVFSGALPGGEIWQSGFFNQGGPTDAAGAAALAQSWFTAMCNSGSTHSFKALSSFWSNTTTVDRCTVYGYATAGTTATFVGTYAGTAIAGIGGPSTPDQSALVLTLNTGLAGRKHRGRMYLPLTKVVLDSNGLVASSDVLPILTAFKLDLDAAKPTLGRLLVVSQVDTASQFVTQISADQRTDTQRRRANRQARGVRQTLTLA